MEVERGTAELWWHGVAWGGMVAVLCRGYGEQWLSVLVLPRQEEEGEERNGRGSE